MNRHLYSQPRGSHRVSLPRLFVPALSRVFVGVGKKPIPGFSKAGSRQPQPTVQSSRSILIIEDDPFSLELFNCLLEASGYTMLLARNGEEGLALARREHPALIVCDVKLPGLGGCEVVRDLKTDPVLERIPIVAVTALGSESDRQRFLASGFDGYIPKPITVEIFVKQIETFLETVKP